MSVIPIITPAEADVFLANYPDWLALTDEQKEAHIYNASLYIQTVWSCTSIDWEDDLTIPEEVDHACALYAYADSIGNLYGSVATPDTRKTTREMIKAGSVTVDEYFSNTGTNETGDNSSFGLPDSLMSLYCTSSSVGSVDLIRV